MHSLFFTRNLSFMSASCLLTPCNLLASQPWAISVSASRQHTLHHSYIYKFILCNLMWQQYAHSLLLLQLISLLYSVLPLCCFGAFLLTRLHLPYDIFISLSAPFSRLIRKVTQEYKWCNYTFVPVILCSEAKFIYLWQFWYLQNQHRFKAHGHSLYYEPCNPNV